MLLLRYINFNIFYLMQSFTLILCTRPMAFSLTGIGAGIVNDFKSMEGDRAFGLESIPLLIGVHAAKWTAALIPDTVQFFIAAYLYSIGETTTAALVLALIMPQIYFQSTLLLPDPFENDVKYMTMSQPFSFLTLLVTALCIGQHEWPVTGAL
jgi:chlorophyll synthase